MTMTHGNSAMPIVCFRIFVSSVCTGGVCYTRSLHTHSHIHTCSSYIGNIKGQNKYIRCGSVRTFGIRTTGNRQMVLCAGIIVFVYRLIFRLMAFSLCCSTNLCHHRYMLGHSENNLSVWETKAHLLDSTVHTFLLNGAIFGDGNRRVSVFLWRAVANRIASMADAAAAPCEWYGTRRSMVRDGV